MFTGVDNIVSLLQFISHYQSVTSFYFIVNFCRFEDHDALHGGDDGLNVIRIILQGAAHILKPNGYVSQQNHIFQLSEYLCKLPRKKSWVM